MSPRLAPPLVYLLPLATLMGGCPPTSDLGPTDSPSQPSPSATDTSPTAPPTERPTAQPTEPPTAQPSERPTAPPTEPPTTKVTETPSPSQPPSPPSSEAPSEPPPPTEPPTTSPSEPPTDPPPPSEELSSPPAESPTDSPCEDRDGDGVCSAQDCNDSDGAVGAAALRYPDRDLDGYGEGSGAPTCTPTLSQAPKGGDCDDSDPTVHPGAPELCDGQPNACESAASWSQDHELGLATFVSADKRKVQQLEGEFSQGRSGAPVSWSPPANGSLSLCGAMLGNIGQTWYVATTIPDGSDVAVRGLGTPGANILSGGGVATTVVIGEYVTFTLDDVHITGGKTEGNGGGISAGPHAEVTVRDALIHLNFAEGDGGGLFGEGLDALTLERVQVQRNRGHSGGGLCLIGGGEVYLLDSILDDNDAELDGGGAWLSGQVVVELTHVEDNTAVGHGGGLYLSAASGEAQDLELRANRLTGDGTAGGNLAQYGGSWSYTRLVASEGEASYGAGLYISGGVAELADAELTNNTAEFDGGALYLTGSEVTLLDGEVSGNVGRSGGGINAYAESTGKRRLTLEGTQVIGNSAEAGGGGLQAHHGTEVSLSASTRTGATMPTLFQGNSASYGGAISANNLSSPMTCIEGHLGKDEFGGNNATTAGDDLHLLFASSSADARFVNQDCDFNDGEIYLSNTSTTYNTADLDATFLCSAAGCGGL